MAIKNDAQYRDAVQKVFKKASTDPKFRQLALSNPNAAVKEATGEDVPAGFKIQFVDNKHANLTIILPDLAPSGELADEQLEQVAGGGRCGGSSVCGGSCGASCVYSAVY